MVYKAKVGGKFSFANLPQAMQNELKERIAQKCDIYEKGFNGVLPGIKIDGKVVTKDNIHEFKVNKKVKPVKKDKPVKVEGLLKVPKEDLSALKKHMVDTMTVKELKAEARKLKVKGAWKMKEKELVNSLVKAGYR